MSNKNSLSFILAFPMTYKISILFVVHILLFIPISSFAQQQKDISISNLKSKIDSTSNVSDIFNLSQEISKDMSKVVGVSISPLLGIGALSAYSYFQTPEHDRYQLPWYNSPKFWIPLLLILILIVSKDFLTAAIPILHPLKKPFNAMENFENIISAIIAMPIIVSLLNNANSDLISIISSNVKYLNITSLTEIHFVEAGIISSLKTISLVIVGVFSFILVWLASHSINVLILLSPFSFIDLLLRSFRLFIIGILVASTAIHPFLGFIISLILIFIGYRISGWSFRLLIFGAIFSSDILSRRHKKNKLDSNEIKVFSNKSIPKIPTRTYGHLNRVNDSSLEFVYKPLLIKPARSILISDISKKCEIGKGLISPVILETDNNSYTILFRMPPRYKSHEQELVEILGIKSIREVGITKGLRALRQWITENFKSKKVVFHS